MSLNTVKVLTVGPQNGAKAYISLRAASRALSGNGTDAKRRTIARRIAQGGGFVGDVWVQNTRFPVGVSRTA